jgi:hypothetical protein
VTYVSADGPEASTAPDAFRVIRRELGIGQDAAQGDSLRVTLPGIERLDAVVDYLTPEFIGLRTEDGLYRFFGRNAFGAPVGFALHSFADGVDPDKTRLAWQSWLDGVFA